MMNDRILTAEQIRSRLKDRRLDIIQDSTGLAKSTISKVRDGDRNPSYKTLVALSEYFLAQESESEA